MGTAYAISGALTAAAAFCLWSAVTTPTDAKHLARGRRAAPARRVIDLVALEAEQLPVKVR